MVLKDIRYFDVGAAALGGDLGGDVGAAWGTTFPATPGPALGCLCEGGPGGGPCIPGGPGLGAACGPYGPGAGP